MTYPPQPPGGGPYRPPPPQGPYGQQPHPYGSPQPNPYGPPSDPYGQPAQPDPYSAGPPADPYGHPAYQGTGAYPGIPPGPPQQPKPNSKLIIAVVVIAVLVLSGAGVAIYLLTQGDDKNDSSGSSGSTASSNPDDKSQSGKPTPDNGGPDGPAKVQQAYIAAYESKSFSSIVANACQAYKDKFGTDTSELEKQLEPYEIKAAPDGEPDVTGSTATAKIDLKLTKGEETKTPKIKIKIVKESGSWKFCGEGEA